MSTKDIDATRAALRLRLAELGTHIGFEDDIWECDRQKYSPSSITGSYRICFGGVPEHYRDDVKYYALKCTKLRVVTIRQRVFRIAQFLRYLDATHAIESLEQVDPKVIASYAVHLTRTMPGLKNRRLVWGANRSFFTTMRLWPGFPLRVPMGRCPWPDRKRDQRIETKYIPDYVTSQLDRIFFSGTLPLHYRTAYWIARSFPIRGAELAALRLDCLKFDGTLYTIDFPQWKQNGGYLKSLDRPIPLDPSKPFELAIIGLIQAQRDEAGSIQNQLTDPADRGCLFTVHRCRFASNTLKVSGEYTWYYLNKASVLDRTELTRMLSSVCKWFDVRGQDGKPYSPTFHQLRHNAITDRLYSGMTLEQVSAMAGHIGTNWAQGAYFHPQAEKDTILQRQVNAAISGSKDVQPCSSIRVVEMSSDTERRLLAYPRAARIGHIGICTSAVGCGPGAFQCLACADFRPDPADLPYFRRQIATWQDKVEKFAGLPQRKEHAQYVLEVHQRIVEQLESEGSHDAAGE